MRYLLLYLLLINALGLILMRIDKKKAQLGRWRIRESTLLTVAALGGSIGTMLGMNLFRHKTKHLRFSLGVPVILILQIMGAVILLSIKK